MFDTSGYTMILRESKRLVLQGKNNLLRKHMRIWKEKAQCKVEYKETMFVNKVCLEEILTFVYYNVWLNMAVFFSIVYKSFYSQEFLYFLEISSF